MKNFKITMNAPVTIGFAALCFLVLILNFITAGKSNQLLFMTYRSSLANPLTYIRLFTHVLGHSSWQHFIGNMGYILLLGPMLEEKYGARNMILVIAIAALATGLVNFIFFRNVALDFLHKFQCRRDPDHRDPCCCHLHWPADIGRALRAE